MLEATKLTAAVPRVLCCCMTWLTRKPVVGISLASTFKLVDGLLAKRTNKSSTAVTVLVELFTEKMTGADSPLMPLVSVTTAVKRCAPCVGVVRSSD